MGKPQILEEESMTMTELKSELSKIKKRDGELSFRAGKAEEYLDNFSLLKEKNANELFEKIEKLKIPRFKKEYTDKLIDVLPRNDDEIKMVLSAYPFTITNENVKKLAKVLKDYSQEKK